MKTNPIVTAITISLCFAASLMSCMAVWADGASQSGGSGAGSGTTPICSANSNRIHEPSCGKNGGGKSWRIYRIGSGTTIDNLDVGADWKIVNGGEGGNTITIVPECVKQSAPYIIILGLNSVVPATKSKKFYVSFNQMPVSGSNKDKCRNNRGCYYNPNNYDAITSSADARIVNNTFYNGQILTNAAAQELYYTTFSTLEGFNWTGAFCTFPTDGTVIGQYSLTAYAVDMSNGNAFLNGGNSIDSQASIQGGDVTVYSDGYNPSGYSWVFWDYGGSICPSRTERNCSVSGIGNQLTVYAYYVRDNFEGKTSISGAKNDSTEWASHQVNRTKQVALGNCASGCTIRFDHQMKTTSGSGSTPYVIKRVSNSPSISSGDVGSGTYSGAGPTTVRSSESMTLYPGMIVCETLRFTAEPASSKSAYSQVCAVASSPAQSGSFIDAQVRNNNASSTYHVWQTTVYAKPGYLDEYGNHQSGDTVDFRSWYNPTVQSVANYTANIINGANVGAVALRNYGGWNNGYDVTTNRSSLAYRKPGTIGSTTQLSGSNSYRVLVTDVGSTISEKAQTNNLIRTVPYSASFGVQLGSSPVITATVDWGGRSKEVYAKVPYNFSNSTEVTTPTSDVAYSGETKSFNFDIDVNPRQNNATNGRYATIVPNARWKIGITYGADKNNISNYQWSKEETNNTLNGTNNLSGVKKSTSLKINIPDLNAGQEICIRTAVYPKDSHDDLNMNPASTYNPGNPNDWSYSSPKCYIIAKRPSIQVWGGNVFSSVNIRSPRSIKNNLAGYTAYHINNSQGTFVFGSWGELGVVSRGTVDGFASGATLGYASKDGFNFSPSPFTPNTTMNTPSPGGSNQSSFCKHSVLTFANSDCDAGTAGGTGGKDSVEGVMLDFDTISSLADIDGQTKNDGDTITIESGILGQDDGNILYKSEGNLTVAGGNLARGTFKIVSAKNITITDNIFILDDEKFEKFRQVSKAVLYASGSGSDGTIYIGCNVTHLDAVLVANRVITCNSSDINSRDNSNQLRINGAIVAGRLYATRTYGAASSVNSIVPAEIIDFDPTLYLWGGAAGAKGENADAINGNIEVTYIHEVAPRY